MSRFQQGHVAATDAMRAAFRSIQLHFLPRGSSAGGPVGLAPSVQVPDQARETHEYAGAWAKLMPFPLLVWSRGSILPAGMLHFVPRTFVVIIQGRKPKERRPQQININSVH